jgi:hypothetical protein
MLVRIVQLAIALYHGKMKRKDDFDNNSTPEADRNMTQFDPDLAPINENEGKSYKSFYEYSI